MSKGTRVSRRNVEFKMELEIVAEQVKVNSRKSGY